MANDSKVTKDLARSKEIFLREPPGFHTGPPTLYSVEQEFKKTKANRSPVVPLVVLAFLVVFGAVAIAVTTSIDRAGKNVPIGISEFQDINLTDILDGQKRNETALKAAQRELADLTDRQQEQTRRIEDDADQRAELLTNQALAAAERDRRVRAVRVEEQTSLARVRTEYTPLVAAKQREIAEIQAQIDAYDSRMIEQAKKSDELLNNQRRLFDAQRDQLTSYYEERIAEHERLRAEERKQIAAQKDALVALLRKNHADEIARLTARYNPLYAEQRVLAVMGRPLPVTTGDVAQLPPFRPVLAAEGIWSSERLQATRGHLEDLGVLLKRLQDTPYLNSVPGALKKIEELQRSVVADYETMWVALASAVERKTAQIAERDAAIRQRDASIRDLDATIRQRDASVQALGTALDQFVYAMNAQTRSSRENGYVLDPRNTARMTVYINPNIPIQQGATAYVFRKEDEPVATIDLRVAEGAVTARLVSLAVPGKPIEPFDKILVQLK